MNLFEKVGLSGLLVTTIKRLGFTVPTPIQKKSIPHIIKGEDIIGESATGSGKTLAFGCGIMENTVSRHGLQALIVTPTRELAEQVKEDLKKLSYKRGLTIIAVYGGVAIGPQIRDLSRAEVVVATPGRLLDHLQRGTVNLSKVKMLILDEADRMFDMGFIEDVERIIQASPKKRQTMFFSATISPRVRDLANKHMNSPVKVSGVKMVDPSKLKQVYYDVVKNMKLSLLTHLLKHEKSGLVMVFCNTRRNTNFVVDTLRVNDINAIAIHGGLTQSKRTKTIELFNKAKVTVLVCTDVAARGLHIENVSHIYNYELPKDPKDYVHRIGRTARAGEEGKVINLLSGNDHENFTRVLRAYPEFSIEKVKRPFLQKIRTAKLERFKSSIRRGFSRGRGSSRRGSPHRRR
jgi:ATP-dependent RNA helicase DeaD